MDCHRGLSCPTPSAVDLQSALIAYADRLTATAAAVDRVDLYRTQKPKEFIDLCKFHLSLLVDLPIDFNNYDPQAGVVDPSVRRSRRRPWTRLASSVNQNHKPEEPIRDRSSSTGQGRTNNVYDSVIKLMDHLSQGDNLKTDMIFRKSGNMVRQRELRRRILSGANISFPVSFAVSDVPPATNSPSSPGFRWAFRPHSGLRECQQKASGANYDTIYEFKAHDYANTLKNVLREMREPILTHELLPVFISVSRLTSGNVNDEGVRVPLDPTDFRVARAKQVVAIRTLRFLLPERNQCLLRRLLDLLTETLGYSQFNGMSAESLGTIFGPLLLTPTSFSRPDLHKLYDSVNDLATLMIKQGSKGVFSVPTALLDDIDRNLASDRLHVSRCHSKDSGVETCSSSSSLQEERVNAALHTGLMFALDASKNRGNVGSKRTVTEYAVAELCASVQALPDSDPRKARLVRRINNSNGGLTPRAQKRRKETLLGSPSFSLHRTTLRGFGIPSTSIFGATETKGRIVFSPEAVIDGDGENDGKVPATMSSSSLDGVDIGSLCCPLFGILSSTVRSGNQVKREQHEHSVPKSWRGFGSPVFADMGAPIDKNVCSTSENSTGLKLKSGETLGFSRRHTCLQRMPVRRNYNDDKVRKLRAPVSSIRDTPSRLRSSV